MAQPSLNLDELEEFTAGRSADENSDDLRFHRVESASESDLSLRDLGTADGNAGRTQEYEGDGGDAAPASRRFDPDGAAQAQYLGDMEELGGAVGLLEEGMTYTMPLFALEGVVLMPGTGLPLILHSLPDLLKLERALRAPVGGPTSRMIAVTHIHRRHLATCLVCCSAEVRRVRRETQGQEGADALLPQQQQGQQQGAGRAARVVAIPGAGGTGPRVTAGSVVAVVARGRQRLLLDPASLSDTYRVRCKVLPEGLAEAPPRQLSNGAGFWAPWAARPFDAPALAALVQRLCSGVLPQIASKFQLSRGPRNPVAVIQYSYWLAANLPLSDEQRQELLECRDTAGRLRLLLSWLSRLGTMVCKECGSPVAQCRSALLMTSEGAGGAFVNAHGYVHDIATFGSVRGLSYVGRPETTHSWFPGYAWTIAVCAACGEHMGWRFNATPADLQPQVFWGLRRSATACPALHSDRGGLAEAGGHGGLPGSLESDSSGSYGTSSSEDDYELVYDEASGPGSDSTVSEDVGPAGEVG